MILYTRTECNEKARAIENEIKRRFGWIVKVSIAQDGRFSWQAVKGRDRYDLYPGMSKSQADAAVMRDIQKIFADHLKSPQLTDYYQSGKMHYPQQ